MNVDYDMIHAHVSREGWDCDGRYLNDYTLRPYKGEDDFDFRERMIAHMVNFISDGTLKVERGEDFFRYNWVERTDEGFVHEERLICFDDCADSASQRDLTAESMGY